MYANFDMDRDKEECPEGKLKLEVLLLNDLHLAESTENCLLKNSIT